MTASQDVGERQAASSRPTSRVRREILFEKIPTKSMRYSEMHIFFAMIKTKNWKIINSLDENQLGI